MGTSAVFVKINRYSLYGMSRLVTATRISCQALELIRRVSLRNFLPPVVISADSLLLTPGENCFCAPAFYVRALQCRVSLTIRSSTHLMASQIVTGSSTAMDSRPKLIFAFFAKQWTDHAGT